MPSDNYSSLHWFLMATALLTVLLPILGNRMNIPGFLLIARWLRWFLFGALFAYFLKFFELSFRPDWVHFVSGLALWFILETGYNWIAIKALSRSEIPLFPQFHVNEDGDEWPADKRFLEVKDWLRSEGYKRNQALKAELFEDTYLRASIYESPNQLTRVQILFLPKRKGGATACYTVTSYAKSNERLITDNLFLPYGGYYPESWNMCRKPLMGSVKRLILLHHKRLLKSQLEPVAFEDDALEEINDQQRILEHLNTENGFLVPRAQQEEEGKITSDGCYRLWKEMWFLAYLSKSVA